MLKGKNFSPCIQKHTTPNNRSQCSQIVVQEKGPHKTSGTWLLKSEIDEVFRNQDRVLKQQQQNWNAKETEVAVSDEVLLLQKRQNKLTSFYEPRPYKVLEKNVSQVLIESPYDDWYKWSVAPM